MAYPKLNIPKLSDVIVEQLEKRILDGVLKPGDRLPPERQLAEEFGVSVPRCARRFSNWRRAACSAAARAAAPG